MVSMPSAAISVAYESSPVVGGTARSRTQDALQVQADTPPRVPSSRLSVSKTLVAAPSFSPSLKIGKPSHCLCPP